MKPARKFQATIPEAIFFLSAAAFVASLPFTPWPGGALLKVVPIACLVILVAQAPGDWRRIGVVLALVCSGAGDIALELGHFTPGLGAFLLGHIAYMAVFAPGMRVTGANFIPGMAVLAGGGGMIAWLAPGLGDMVVPVCLYTTVISCMALAAILGRANGKAVALGAIVFVISDSLIAIDRFVDPVPGARYWIMTFYYAAQYLLSTDARSGRYQPHTPSGHR